MDNCRWTAYRRSAPRRDVDAKCEPRRAFRLGRLVIAGVPWAGKTTLAGTASPTEARFTRIELRQPEGGHVVAGRRRVHVVAAAVVLVVAGCSGEAGPAVDYHRAEPGGAVDVGTYDD